MNEEKMSSILKKIYDADHDVGCWKVIRSIFISKESNTIIIDCYPGSSVEEYLIDLFKEFGLEKYIDVDECEFIDWGSTAHDYEFSIKKEFTHIFKSQKISK